MNMPQVKLKHIVLLSVSDNKGQLCCHIDISPKVANQLLMMLVEAGQLTNLNISKRDRLGQAIEWDATMIEGEGFGSAEIN